MLSAPRLSTRRYCRICFTVELSIGGVRTTFARPADVFCDLPQRRPVLADDNSGFFRFDQHFTGIGIKKDIGDPGGFRNYRLDLVVGLFRVFENSRADDDPLAQVAGK